MSKITRRETLARGGRAVAAAAVLPFLPSIAHAEEDADTALFHLVDQYETATKAYDELKKAWCEQVRSLVAPQYRDDPYSDPHRTTRWDSRSEKARDLEVEMQWAMDDYRSAAMCTVKTPARSMRGVAAKMRMSEGGKKWRGLRASALADAERLAGHGRAS